jgi:hypothetical protein
MTIDTEEAIAFLKDQISKSKEDNLAITQALLEMQEIVYRQNDKNFGDYESDHVEADRILCDLITQLTGSKEIEKAFDDINKWYA